MKSPAFQFYPNDFLAGRVATYSLETIGAYIMLLSFEWSLGGLPLDEADHASSGGVCPKLSRNSLQTFAKLCRTSTRKFERMWVDLHGHFEVCEDGKLRNPRLQREREKQLAYSESMSANGKRGGRPRKPEKSRGLAAVKPDKSISSPSSSSITTTAIAGGWTARLAAVWSERVGEVAPGYVGKRLQSAHEKHGIERVERAMLGYIAARKAAGGTLNFGWFAKEIEVWIGRTTQPIDVIDGEMSDTLELLTRPALVRAS